MNNQKGVGLAEILISLLLSSLIMTALMHQYIKIKQHYVRMQALLEQDTEMQLAIDVMRDSIRQAGFAPCLGIDRLMTVDKLKGLEIKGHELFIHRMSSSFETILTINNATKILTTHTNNHLFSRPILIADCVHAEIQTVKNVQITHAGKLINLSQPLLFDYTPPIYVGEWLDEQFFVPPAGGLFYKVQHADELTHVIKKMLVKRLAGNPAFVSVSLQTDRAHSIDIETRVRAQ